MSEPPRQHKGMSSVLSLGGAGRASPSLLSPEPILERARGLAQLDDFGPDVTPALRAFCGFFGEIALSDQGLRSLSWHASQALVTRLRLVRARQETPALFETPLNDPLIIVSLPRTGTSLLQRLLSALPGRRYLRFWEAREPIPDAHDDQRIAYYEHFASLLSQAAPALAAQHRVDAHGPEECMFLLDPSLVSLSFVSIDAPCRAYFDWVHEPHEEPYAIYRQLLQYLQASAPGSRLVLKSPAHFGQLTALMRAVPEARLVHIHRDPLLILASTCSLQETLLASAVESFEPERLGREALEMLEMLMARNEQQRQLLPAAHCFDLQFDELVGDPFASVQRLHGHFGLRFSHDDERALRAELAGVAAAPADHRYSLADYGLREAEVAERLATYRKRWAFDSNVSRA